MEKEKKKVNLALIIVLAVIAAAVVFWCVYNATKSKGLNGILGLSGIVPLLFGIFVCSAIGYLLGRITVKGVSLGTAGVFLVAILFGYLCTIEGLKDVPVLGALYISGTKDALYTNYSKIVQNIGLVLFVGAVGSIAGPTFFKNLKKNAKSYVLLGVIIILIGSLCAVLFALIPGIGAGFSVGILSGALTTTPGFSAAQEAMRSIGQSPDIVTLGHAIAYPFGVVGVVLFVQLMPKFLKVDMAQERSLLKIGDLDQVKQKKDTFECDPFGLMPFALSVIAGLLLGAVKIPLSGKGYDGTCFSLGTTGGVLIMCLIFGHFGHFGKLSLEVPEHTAKVFREFGLMMFLIGAGVSGGVSLVSEISKSSLGAMLVVYGFIGGIVMTIVPMLVGFFIAKKFLKLPLLNNLGSITGGMTSTPALGTLISTAGTDDVASAYASTYPIALVLIVLASQFIITLM